MKVLVNDFKSEVTVKLLNKGDLFVHSHSVFLVTVNTPSYIGCINLSSGYDSYTFEPLTMVTHATGTLEVQPVGVW